MNLLTENQGSNLIQSINNLNHGAVNHGNLLQHEGSHSIPNDLNIMPDNQVTTTNQGNHHGILLSHGNSVLHGNHHSINTMAGHHGTIINHGVFSETGRHGDGLLNDYGHLINNENLGLGNHGLQGVEHSNNIMAGHHGTSINHGIFSNHGEVLNNENHHNGHQMNIGIENSNSLHETTEPFGKEQGKENPISKKKP